MGSKCSGTDDERELREDENDDVTSPSPSQSRRRGYPLKKSYSIQNGYEGLNRNLIDDAKFENKLVRKIDQLQKMKSRESTVSHVSTDVSEAPLHSEEDVFTFQPMITGIHSICEKEEGQKWFPRTLSEIDQCNHIVTKFEPELDMDHPGWSDHVYRQRRSLIAQIAFHYKHGDKIPFVEYTEAEIETWDEVLTKMEKIIPSKTSSVYQHAMEKMKKYCGFRLGQVPQLQNLSDYLEAETGFILHPAAGLVTARDFLACLAHRVFLCTQYMRHPSMPHHSPEPDVIHELLGHCPMFADPEIAQFSQEIGLASLGASDETIVQLATLYWFTIEFGLCRENGEIRVYGAGLLSSYGELLHALSTTPQYIEFEPETAALQKYDDQAYQEVYFIANGFKTAIDLFREWVDKRIKSGEMQKYVYDFENKCVIQA